MTSHIPNLDAMNQNELMEFWEAHHDGGGFRTLFPAGGPGVIKATRDLAAYAYAKALRHEGTAAYIYARLPEWAKW